MTRHAQLLLIGSALLLFPGCYSTTDITTYRDLAGALPHSLRIMAVDTTIYDLERFSFTDTLIEGQGKHYTGGEWVPFTGRLPMSRIVYVQSRSFNTMGSIAGIALIGLTAGYFSQAGSTDGLEIHYAGGGGSCPYVYAWNGTAYIREGEVFGTAFGKGLETSTGCMLPNVSAGEKVVRVRIADERPETHYVNSVRLSAYEAPPGARVYLDTRGCAWPITSLEPPLRGPREIVQKDGLRWKSDGPRSDYHEVVDLTLPLGRGAREGSLVVNAINTHLSESAIDMIFSCLGEESLPFLYRIEHDSATISLMRSWIDECALHADVWNGTSWTNAGAILPEANEVPFARVVRIRAPEGAKDSVRVRLRMLADTWEIDAVGIDWSETLPLVEHEIPSLVALHSRRGSVDRALRYPDAEYTMLLPGEYVDITFPAYEPRPGNHVSYACTASGYLYEWLPEKPAGSGERDPFAALGLDRMSLARYFLRNHEAFLPVLFARWESAERTMER